MNNFTSSSFTPESQAVGPAGPPPRIPDHELLRQVGRGAYGEVWLARSVTGAFRAVKIVRRSSFEHDRPFEREFHGIQKFEPLSRRHDSQVDVLHVGRGADYFYYVMELADDQASGGQIDPENYLPRTLKSDLLFHSRLHLETCISVAVALTTALEHLHQNGLVHRDVKPSNIIFVNGVPKLADIGLVTGVDATRSYVGTEGFAAPEGPGTPQADLFSLGKVLYEISTGKDRQEFPELPSNLRELPDREGLVELNAVIARACRHDPRDRYASAAEMRADLELLQSGKSLARLRRTERRLAVALRVGGLAVLLTLLFLGAWLYQTGQTSKVRKLVSEKEKVLEENRNRLAAQYITSGSNLLDTGDPAGALVFFSQALPLLTNNTSAESLHRIRIQQTLKHMPALEALFAHESAPFGTAFSPDGKVLAVSTEAGFLHLWEVSSGKRLIEPLQLGVAQQTMLFNAQGSRLLMSPLVRQLSPHHRSRRDATVFDTVHHRVVFNSESNLHAVAFSEDGKWLVTVSTNALVQVTDTDTGENLAAWSAPVYPINNVSVRAAEGVLLANGTNDTIHVWKALTGEILNCPQQTGFVYFSGKLAVACEQHGTNYSFRSWDILSGRSVGVPIAIGSTGDVQIAKGPDPRQLLLFRQAERTAHVYELESGNLLKTFTAPENVRLIAPAHAWSHVAFAEGQHIACVWDAAQGRVLRGRYFLGATITEAQQFCPKDSVLITTDEGTAELWRFGTPTEDARAVLSAAIAKESPESFLKRRSGDRTRAVVQLKDNTAALLDLENLQFQVLNFNGMTPGRAALDWSGGQAAVAYEPLRPGEPYTVVLWRHNEAKHKITADSDITDLRFSEDGKTLFIVTKEPLVRMVNAETGECTSAGLSKDVGSTEPGDVGPILADGSCFVVRRKEGILLANLKTGGMNPTFIPPQMVVEVASRLDPPWFLTVSGEGLAQLWDSSTGTAVTPPVRHGSALTYGEISPSARRFLVSGRSPEIRVVDVPSGELALPLLRFGTKSVVTAAWSPDDKYIVARNDERMARVWDSESGQPMTPSLQHDKHVIGATLTPSNRLVTISFPGVVRSWHLTGTSLPPDVISDYAMAISGRRLNPAGIPVSLSPEQRAGLFQSLRERAPELFTAPR